MGEVYFETKFYSDMNLGRNALNDILSFIESGTTVDKDSYYDLKLIFSELIFNSIIHGNKYDKRKNIMVRISLSRDGYVDASIRDEGSGFDYAGLVKKTDSGCDAFSENGRGIMLANALSDSFRFNVTGNEINFSKKVN